VKVKLTLCLSRTLYESVMYLKLHFSVSACIHSSISPSDLIVLMT